VNRASPEQPPRIDLMLPALFPVQQVAEALSLSVSHLRREIRLRKLAVVRVGRRVLISPEAIEAYLAKRSRSAR
jgi:excisionase family DNA binding protein